MRLICFSRLAASFLIGTAAVLHVQAVGCGSGDQPGRTAVAGVSIKGKDGDRAVVTQKPTKDRKGAQQGEKTPSETGGIVSIPGPRPVESTYQSALTDMQPELVRKIQRSSDEVLISPNRQRVWIPRGSDSIEPSVEHEEVENGFDLTFTYSNSTSTPKRLGEIVVGGIRFPETITTRAIFNDGKPIELSHNNAPYFGGGGTYPGGMYSPVAVLQAGAKTVGVSMLYDVREYRHDVFIRVESPGGIYTYGGRNWQVRFVFDRDENDEGGRILPGETRTYRVCVRATHESPAQWVRTLVPYREFFQATYGPVQYERDPRPVAGLLLATSNRTSPSNPRGFVGSANDRPDLVGFVPIVEQLESLRDDGYERIMVWTPTGLYRVNSQNNYPYNFTSGWSGIPAMNQSKHILAAFGASSTDLGLWWGNSSKLMTRTWDASHAVPFDNQYPFHVNRAREEMDGAVAVNATTIGLDAMSSMPAWDAYDWMLQLRSEYPEVRFVFETMAPDFIHTVVPTYLYGTRIPQSDPFAASRPHALADFLNPGHETWAHISGHDVKINAGLPSTSPVPQDLLYKHAEEAASYGYVPVIFGKVLTTDGLEARQSWLYTVPEDLLQD